MRIKITEIEASAEDLRQSKSLSDAFTDAFRNAFVVRTPRPAVLEDEEEDDE